MAEARDGGATGLLIYCVTTDATGLQCGHAGRMGMTKALRRWGAARRLDAIPLRCSRCDGRAVDVRPDYPSEHKAGGWHNIGSPLTAGLNPRGQP